MEHTLPDLDMSVNLLLYSIYEELGLGELKKTHVTLLWLIHQLDTEKVLCRIFNQNWRICISCGFCSFGHELTNRDCSQDSSHFGSSIPSNFEHINQLYEWSHANLIWDNESLRIFYVSAQPHDIEDVLGEVSYIHELVDNFAP